MALTGDRILVGRPEGKRLLGRPRRRQEYTIKMSLQEVGWGSMDWVVMWAGHVALTGDRVLVGRPEGKRLLGRPRRRQEYSIKMSLQEVGWGSLDWVDLAPDRGMWRAFLSAVMVLGVP